MGKASPIELDASEASAKGRPLAIHLAVSSLRVLEGYRAALGNVDRIGTVAAAAAASLPFAGSEEPDRGCTMATVAVLSQSDKETSRRRILRLADDGVLVRDGGRVRLNPLLADAPMVLAALRRHAAELARLANAFGELGVLGREAGRGIRLEPAPAWTDATVRSVAPILLASVHRSFEAYRAVAGTTDHVLIQLAVVAITSQHLTRAELPGGLDDLRLAIPADRLAVCNISSIAAAAGLPFETARRKTSELVAGGLLARHEAGNVRFAPGVLQQPAVYDLVTYNAAKAAALADQLLRLGLLVERS